MTIMDAINDTAKALTNLSKLLVAVAEQTEGISANVAVKILAKKVDEKAETKEETTVTGFITEVKILI